MAFYSTVEQAIQAALFAPVRDSGLVANDHKAWPNMTFDPPADAYLQIDHLPNNNQRLFIEGRDPHMFMGILQITAITPLNDGPETANRLASEIARTYYADRALWADGVKVRIEKAPDVGQAEPVDASWNAVVSIRYQSIVSPDDYGIPSLRFFIAENSQYVPLI